MAGSGLRRHWWLKPLVHLSVLAIVAWGVWGTITHAIAELDQVRWQLNPFWLIAASTLYLIGLLPMGLFWFQGLSSLGQHPRLWDAIRAFYISQIGKYAPGKAMVVVVRTGLIHGERVSGGVAAASVFLETLTMMAVGAFLAAIILLAGVLETFSKYGYLLPLALALMLLAGLPTIPTVFRRLVMRLGVGRNDPKIEEKLSGLSFKLILSGWIRIAGGWLFFALSLWAVLRALGIEDLEPFWHLNYYTVSITLAIVTGFVSLFPGGAGVRELVLSAILGQVYLAGVLNLPLASATALAAAVVLRLVWLGTDVLVASVLYVGMKWAEGRDL